MTRRIERDPRTDADVQRLLQVFDDLLPDGRTIKHEQIEAALTLNRLSSRYRTVTNKWRRVLQHERAIVLDGRAAEGQGFVSLTPDDMIRFSNRGVRALGRRIRKLMAIASVPSDAQLSADMAKYRHRLAMAIAQIAGTHGSSIRDVSRSLQPLKQLPQRVASGQDQ